MVPLRNNPTASKVSRIIGTARGFRSFNGDFKEDIRKGDRMATIKEIAALAGVSRGTVDRVLNHRGSVNPATAEKIEKLARDLDYRPNRAGLVLAAQKKNLTLGVILFSNENPFYTDVLTGVQEKAEELSCYNCTVLVRQIAGSVEAQLEAMDQLVQEGAAGIALAPYNDERIRRRIDQLYHKGIPVVTLNTDIEHSRRMAYVGSNYFKSGSTAAGLLRLMTQGQVHVGIITGSSNILCHTERIAGFTEALKPFQGSIRISRVAEVHDNEDESYEKTRALLSACPEINALYFAAGGVWGGCQGAVSLGLQEKLRIIANDLVPTTRQLVEQGTIAAVICQQPKIQGSRPLDLLFTYLTTGQSPEKEHHYVMTDIRIRENL